MKERAGDLRNSRRSDGLARRIGSDELVGPHRLLLASSHEIARTEVPMDQQDTGPDRAITFEDAVPTGAGVTMLLGRRTGRCSIVGAGAVVFEDAPWWAVVDGGPAVIAPRRAAP